MKNINKIWIYPLILLVTTLILVNGCKKKDENNNSNGNVPILTTSAVSNISPITATCGGNITSDGGSAVIARGVCWSIGHTPTINNSITTDGTGTGNFTSVLTYLTPNTTYYLRAYATNNVGTGYGNELEFSTGDFTNCGTMTDIDGNIYKTVTIGTQCWMRENLKVMHYRNGDPIPNVTDDTVWHNLLTGAYCDYNNIPGNSITYGKLYNWYAVNDSREIAPSGWHVPTDAEWTTLANYLGGSSIAGGKLKETGMTHWNSPNTNATNESGFSALPGGIHGYYSLFVHMCEQGNWWTATAEDTSYTWFRLLTYNTADIQRNYASYKCGFSVRCVKD